jgi:gluconate 2-dehydrogenase gamma chain
MTETRRVALRMLGAVGATCAFPFAGEELYGQHVHPMVAQAPAAGPYMPAFFTKPEYSTLARLADAIIPATSTPGAAAAGVPEYIDRVVSLNAEHQPLVRAGLAWLEQQAHARFSRDFQSLGETEHAELLRPLSEEVDRVQRELQRARYRVEGQSTVYYVQIAGLSSPLPQPAATARVDLADPGMPARFFRLVKNLTADGYYTSRVGLIEELGYKGNTFLAAFPACSILEQ